MQDEILDLVNETLETEYELDTPADEVLEEAWNRPEASTAAPGGTWAALLGGEDLDSSDGEDESFKGSASCSSADACSNHAGSTRGCVDSAACLQGIGFCQRLRQRLWQRFRVCTCAHQVLPAMWGRMLGFEWECMCRSSGGSSSDGSAEVLEGRRRRAPVDYVALAAAMFGEHSESEKDSDSDDKWD